MFYKVVEKDNHNAVHALCGSRDRAQWWIDVYGGSGIFDDTSLTRESFEILPPEGAK